jgi:hypothetical protein
MGGVACLIILIVGTMGGDEVRVVQSRAWKSLKLEKKPKDDMRVL